MRVEVNTFIGRAAELEHILASAGLTANGLQAVLVSGPPGIGKTALLHRTASELHGVTVLWAIGDSWESEVPYGVISQLVAPVRPDCRTDYPLLFGLNKLNESHTAPHQVGAELVELISQLDVRQPVALIIDDLSAADGQSLRALAFAVRRLRDARALLVAAARPARLVREPDAVDWRMMLPAGISELQLGEFDRDEVMAMVRGHGVAWLPPNRLDWLTRYTGGHPMYLRSLLASVEPARLLADTGGGGIAPRSVVAAVVRQTQSLPGSSVQLLEALAVLDGRYPLAVVAKLAGVQQPDEAVVPLLAEHLVQCWPHMPSTPIRIRYPVQRDAVYETIAPSRRRSLHTAALRWSHGHAAWAHRVAASDRIDAQLAADLEAAAQGVLHEGRPARAATFLLWAADLSGFPPERERRTLQAAAHLLWNYRFSRAEPLFTEVENAADSPLRSCILARYSMMRGWFSAAETGFRRVLVDPGQGQDRSWVQALAATGLASLYCWLGRGADTASAARVPDADDRHPELARLARQYVAAAVMHTVGPAAAVDEIDAQLNLPERASSAFATQADGVAWRGLFRGLHGQLTAAVDDADVVVRLMESGVVAEVEITPQYSLAWAQYLLGQWSDAATNAEHAISLAVAEGKSWAHAYSHMVAALVASGRGDWLGAETSVAETARWVRAFGPPQYVVFAAMAAAALAQVRGDHPAVLRALRPLAELTSPGEVTGWPLAYEAWWRLPQAEALIATGQLATAQPVLSRLAELASGMPVLAPAVAWLSGSMLWARGDELAALDAFSAGLQSLEPGVDSLPLYRAQLDEAYGRLLVQTRKWRAGFYRLERAHQAYVALGAAPFAERCALHLSASGVVPQQRVAGPLTLLTERERAIAALVTQGLTNQEVAARLYISSKTVSHHLGRIFTKLGISSRRELRNLVEPD